MKKFKAVAAFKNKYNDFEVVFVISAENKKQALVLAKSAQLVLLGNFSLNTYDAVKVKLCE